MMSVMRHEGWHAAQDCMAGTIENNFIAILNQRKKFPGCIRRLQRMLRKCNQRQFLGEEAYWAGHTEGMTAKALESCAANYVIDYDPTPMTREWLEEMDTLLIEQDAGTEDLYIKIPRQLLERLGWEEGDEISWRPERRHNQIESKPEEDYYNSKAKAKVQNQRRNLQRLRRKVRRLHPNGQSRSYFLPRSERYVEQRRKPVQFH